MAGGGLSLGAAARDRSRWLQAHAAPAPPPNRVRVRVPLPIMSALLAPQADNGVQTAIYTIMGGLDSAPEGERRKQASTVAPARAEEPLAAAANGGGGKRAKPCAVGAEDAFALLFLVNSVAIAAVFYLGPLLVQTDGPDAGRSSPDQFNGPPTAPPRPSPPRVLVQPRAPTATALRAPRRPPR